MLDKKPFYCKPATWHASINMIKSMLAANQHIFTITAESGGGKSTFIHLLQEEIDSHANVFSIKCQPQCSSEILLADLLHTLDLGEVNTQLMQEIIQHSNARNECVLLLIDDAHHLSLDFLVQIINAVLTQSSPRFFNIALVMSPEYSQQLLAITDHSITQIVLGELTALEANTYLLSRVMQQYAAKYPPKHILFQQAYQYTQGNLSALNHYADKIIIQLKSAKFKLNYIIRLAIMVSLFGIIGVPSIYWVYIHNDQIKDAFVVTEQKPTAITITDYTIQLKESRRKVDILRFIQSHCGLMKVNIKICYHDGAVWYAAVLGRYTNLAQALAAIDKMPHHLLQYKPLAKSLKIFSTVLI